MRIDSETLEAIRPQPLELDPVWSAESVAAILATEATRGSGPRRTGRRRAAVTGLALAATAVTGIGVAAAATGLTSQSFTRAFSSWENWPGHDGADPATAVRVASAPGPHHTVFSVLSTDGEQGHGCRTAVFESAESATRPVPSTFTGVYGDFCSSAPTFPTFGGVGVSYDDLGATFTVSAGRAVRAEVRTRGGQEYPALLVGGDFWGWFPKAAHATLVGYADDGSVVGTAELS